MACADVRVCTGINRDLHVIRACDILAPARNIEAQWVSSVRTLKLECPRARFNVRVVCACDSNVATSAGDPVVGAAGAERYFDHIFRHLTWGWALRLNL